ncbi:RNA 2'-phosphotransferase [Nocardioides jishulii]|uniref:RNA 2'-phosphotransferase n=1 Tax=Nocardioides jishulii TaxID=2575440 RepID=UPI001484D294|nr:RNA 2'-phosphotransferase [Nocardioides jishulii]
MDSAYLEAFSTRYGTEWLAYLTDDRFAIRAFPRLMDSATRRTYWEILELLLLEHWISSHPSQIAETLDRRKGLDKRLLRLREAIALALYSRAKSVNWQEPLTFLRGLRVSELYMRSVIENRHLIRHRQLRQFQGRLGVALVLQSRHGAFSAAQAVEMVERIRASLDGGNQNADAYNYLAEALLRVHDASGDPDSLRELVGLQSRSDAHDTAALSSHIAEAWLRLSQAAQTEAGRQQFRARSAAQCENLKAVSDPVIAARVATIRAFLSLPPSNALKVRGFRTPFGVGSQTQEWARQDRVATKELLEAIDHQLDSLSPRLRSSALIRRISASTKSEIAARLVGRAWSSEKVGHLKDAVQIREGTSDQGPLTDPESRLQNAVDRFQLFRSTSLRSHLLAAIEDILRLANFDQAWPTPLLVLARELEALGSDLPKPIIYELRKKGWDSGAAEALRHASVGNLAGLYELAAQRALESREVDRKHLGGRSGVYLAEDPSGIISETFIFKPTLNDLADRETERVSRLERHLKQLGLESRFSVPTTLAKSQLPADDSLRAKGCEILVARRFHKGEILVEAMRDQPLGTRSSILNAVVQYLAIIHASELLSQRSNPVSVRRDLWKKDFGRWLKNGLQVGNAGEVFEEWWKTFGPDPLLLPRRDAHPLNWIVGADNSVVAVDFEACGWRPVGLELAQLLDDRPLLPIDEHGWKTRLHLVHQYRHELGRRGVAVDHGSLVRAWEAATLSRAVGLLTAPSSDQALRSHGEGLLEWLSRDSKERAIRDMASHLLHTWSVRRGTAINEDDGLKNISDARRRHLSRAMAYELRHGSSVTLDRGGWAYIAAVSDSLYASGLRTDSSEIWTVAAAIDEPRFELRGKKIRARYGHTRPVEISYQEASSRPTLYHGTSSRNLSSIFTSGAGLKSMGRQWVHLSSDPHLAIRTAQRHGPVILLALEPEAFCEPVFQAGGSVYLAKAVPAGSLRIVSPTEIFFMSDRGR